MAFKLANRVKMTVSGTPGTGSITLGSAITGYVSFATGGIVDGDTVSYVIEDGTSWEIGVGTYTSTGTTLARTSITASSNSGTAITASSNAIVMISPLAADLQSTDTLTSGTLPVARGGTGLTSLTASRIPYASATNTVGTSANLTFDGGSLYVGQGGSNQVVATNDGSLEIARAAGGPYIDMKAATASDYDCRIQSVGSGSTAYLQIKTGQGTGSFDFSSSGNLGLGVTPSASWLASAKVMQLGVSSASVVGGYAGSNVWALVNSNVYYDSSGNPYYLSSDYATSYWQYQGQHRWYTAGSSPGTGGASIGSFTQAMTLDASGRLGINETSPQKYLSIKENYATAPDSNPIEIYLRGYAGSSKEYAGIGFAMGEHTNGYFGASIHAFDDTSNYGAAITFKTASGSATPTPTEKMRLTSDGNLLVGTTSSPTGAAKVMSLGTATAPTANVATGDCAIWFDGTNLKARVGATVKTITWS